MNQKDSTTIPLTLNLRLVMKDNKGRVQDSLTQSFDLVVQDDPEEVNPCASVTLK